uniref:Elastin microfibril interfacer 3 n=1 Tax=Pelodiscus sinensis TaxID=13735 RepID=K7FZX7_PELSI|nr:EMILIN-3 [Pelodiscus sinensis]|eukprot:XP_006121957.1 EMILIN-3 [Pelodiscus sinensis]
MSRTRGESLVWVVSYLCLGALGSLTDAKGTYYHAPAPVSYSNRYSLYTSGSSPQLSPGKPTAKHRSYCAYVVQRNVTCTLQDGVESYVKAEYHKCSWGPKCPGKVLYRTFFRPKYKIGYKTVTELAWRCCPGLMGEGCHDSPTDQPGLLPQRPSPKIPPGHKMFPGPRVPPHPQIHPEPFPSPKKNHYGRKMPGLFGDRLDHLEEEVRRLSQSYDSLHNMVSGLGDRLRLAIQEDTNKMIGSLMNSPSVPDSTVGFGVIPDGIVDVADKADIATYPPMGEILAKVTEVSDVLKTKTDLLDEVHGRVLDHDGQIKHLLESARPSPLTSIDMLEEYVDTRLSNLRAELLDGFEKKLVKIQSSCDFRIKEVQQQCEEEKAANLRLQQTLDGKELEIKKEISQLETQIQGLTVVESCCSNLNYLTERMDILEKGLHSISDSQKNLHSQLNGEFSTITLGSLIEGRLEDLESRFNATERETGSCCSSLEDSMMGMVGSELDGVRTLFEDKMRTLEDRFMTIVGELNNVSAPAGVDGAMMPFLEGELANMRKQTDERLEGLQSRLITLESTCLLGCTSASKDVETFRTEIEDCQSKNQDLLLRMDSNNDLLRKLNATILDIQRRIEEEAASSLQGEITLLKINLNTVSKSLTGLQDSVSQYSNTMLHVNSSLDEHERKIEDEVHSLQEKVSDQGSQLIFSGRRVLNLKGDLERLKARIMNDLGHCKSAAQDLQKEVAQFDGRVAQVENMCGRLGAVTGSLDLIRDELEKHTGSLWGYMDHMNGTVAAHSQEITVLKDNLLDCQAKVMELAEQVSHLEGASERKQH